MRITSRTKSHCQNEGVYLNNESLCEFSLTGLVGWGSIPLGIACFGGLLTFLGLSALGYVNQLPHKQRRKEAPMKQTSRTRFTLWFHIKKSMVSTVWAIGAGLWSGSALSG